MKLKSKSGELMTLGLCTVFGIIGISFIMTVVDGTFAKQVDKIKAAHNAPITVDKDVTGNAGNF